MLTMKLSRVFLVCVCITIVLASGCSSELEDLKNRNAIQQKEIDTLRADVAAKTLELDNLNRQLADAKENGDIEIETLEQKIAALEEDLAKKQELIDSMQNKLLYGTQLPVELSTKLEDFAEQYDLVTFDADRGIVKFKSDLLFEVGSDKVAAEAIAAVKSLCGILNSEEAKGFDIIIAGHTDDIPIEKPATLAKHSNNWYLSVHRAVSVLNVMAENKIDPKRMSARGFGEYRPVAENKPNKKGNPLNRRVEIFIVPEGI
jgi:chemotaxis protein MotB